MKLMMLFGLGFIRVGVFVQMPICVGVTLVKYRGVRRSLERTARRKRTKDGRTVGTDSLVLRPPWAKGRALMTFFVTAQVYATLR